MKNFIGNILMTDPEADGVGTKRLVLYVISAALIGTLTFSLLDINRQPMLVLAIVFAITLILAINEYVIAARWISLLAAMGVVALLMLSSSGIHNSILPGMIVILNAAGLLTGRRGTVIFGIISLGIIILVGILEQQGAITNQVNQATSLADVLTIIIITVVAIIVQWLMIDHLHQNFQRSQQKLLELESTQILLLDAETRYRNLVEKIPVVVYISEPGEAGKWQYVSPQILTLTGYTPNEWINNPHLWYSRIHPDDRSQVVQHEKKALDVGEMPQLEYRLLTRDEKYIWVYDESLLTMDSQQHGMVQGFMLDITARKVAEEQLQNRLDELEAMRGVSETLTAQSDLSNLIEKTGDQIRQTYKASTIFIAIHDPATKLIHFPYDYEGGTKQKDNPIQYGQGLTSKVMEIGQPLLIKDNWEAEAAKYDPIYRNKKRPKSSVTVPLMIRDHAIGVISVDNTEIENAFSENDVRLLSTIAANLAVALENTRLQESLKKELDIQEKLVVELEHKNEELERFTYTASHDLKSPLITIRGFLGYIEQDARSGNFKRLKLDMQRISEATEKMHRLLNELLELSRAGRITNKAEDISFSEIVKDAIDRVEGQLKEKQVTVKVGSDLPIVHADRERLVEVIQNLVDNAVKFMGTQKKPEIEIGSKIENKLSYFFVRDNGIGIRKEFHEKVFGLFDKLDSESDGTGIGLALVKRIIEVHGGRIWIESEEGKGTTFFFTLG